MILDDVKLPFSFSPVIPILVLCKKKNKPKNPTKTNQTQNKKPQPNKTNQPTPAPK